MQSLSPKLTGQVEVLLPIAIGDGFDYRVPEGMSITRGAFVLVPFGTKAHVGIVAGAGQQHIPDHKCKEIAEVYEHLSPVTDAFVRFLTLCARYYMSPRNLVTKMALPQLDIFTKPATQTFFSLATPPSAAGKIHPSHQAVLNLLADGKPKTLTTLQETATLSPQTLRTMLSKGLIHKKEVITLPSRPSPHFAHPTLSDSQYAAAQQLIANVEKQTYHACLLEGVTGSGKTEVYFEAIEACLKRGKQALILLPEIALSVQWTLRFKQRFGFEPIIWHSAISASAKRQLWTAAATGQAPVIVGARSALFIPCPNLGLIIVDEEHEATYKQEDHVMYHARDMAVARANAENIPIILASASPSLETLYNVEQGKYQHIHLTDRFAGATMPDVTLVDMKQAKLPATKWLSPTLISKLHSTLAQGHQAILFLNRKGYAPLILCRHCGHRFACPSCSSWLVLHKSQQLLCCHHCGYTAPEPKNCTECGQADTLAACGPGTERITEETIATFPQARITTITSDHLTNKESYEREIQRIINGEVDIIIGTQVLAKGHHFPLLTLVGILDADLGLSGGDLRCVERSWQLLHQIAGRAGREKHQGHVYIQTWQPEHPLMQALAHHNDKELIQLEKTSRSDMTMPPYGRLASIILEGTDEQLTKHTAQNIAHHAPSIEHVSILGPAPCVLYKLRNRYRWRFLVKTPRNINIQRILYDWLHHIKMPSTVRCKIDIDPYSFL